MLRLLRVLNHVSMTSTASTDIEVLVAVLALSGGHRRCVVLILGCLGPSSTSVGRPHRDILSMISVHHSILKSLLVRLLLMLLFLSQDEALNCVIAV